MKIKFNLRLLITLIILSYTGFLLVNTVWRFEPSRKVTIGIIDTFENDLKPIYPVIPDSLSHRVYVEKQDSIARLRWFQNRNVERGITATLGPVISTSKIGYCDTCTLKTLELPDFKYNDADYRYFINLLSWKIEVGTTKFAFPDSVQYFVRSGQPYLRKEAEFPLKNKPNHFIARLIDEPVKYWYNERDNCIMISVDETTMQIVRIIAGVLAITFTLYVLWLFGSCLHFILDLSKGRAFTTNNVKRLKLLAFTLLFYPLVIFVFNILLKWIFNSHFNEDVLLNNKIWFDSRGVMIAGIIVWFLYKAFKQGKKLKDEQDLTV
jgi:hypothetical protein